MKLSPKDLMKLRPPSVTQSYGPKDVILYALSIGAGSDPGEDELHLVYEENLSVLPTMAVALGYPGFWQRDPRYNLDWRRIVQGEQWIEIHHPIPPSGVVRSECSIDELVDKGSDKGAVMRWSRQIFNEASGDHLATVRQATFLRGDGGFGGRFGEAAVSEPEPTLAAIPDVSVVLKTRHEQALFYRLNGDLNPLHVDPAAAQASGFSKPILHGLCTYGFAGRAVVRAFAQRNPEKLRRLSARFSSPVFPGETLRFDIWEVTRKLYFRCVAVERDQVVLTNGFAQVEA